jgi:hypothetical protein
MGAYNVITLSKVWAILAICAPGYSKSKTDHHWVVTFNGLVYPTLPLGKHGHRKNSEIQAGHLRTLARTLGIWTCVKKKLDQ